MKIGIITVHNVINYGAVFQAFALKEYLRQSLSDGDYINVINYVPAFLENKKKIRFSKDIRADLIEFERLLMRNKINRRDKAFESFINRNDSLTNICRTKEEIYETVKDYDILISGSDQIWNFYITGGDKAYLLDFPKFTGIKMSYASSLGSYRFYKSSETEIAEILNSFSFLSCREKDGCEYIEHLTGRECVQVCDPTLLIQAEAYAKLFEGRVRKKIQKLAEKDFLLIYNLSNSEEIYQTARTVADENNYKIYQIFPSLRKNRNVSKLLNDISPEEFLYLYSKAKFIVTNSFHGTCFSLINGKDFYTVNPTGSNNRLSSMLGEIGLEDRLLVDGKTASESDNGLTINYSEFQRKIERFTSESKDYLNTAVAVKKEH